MKSFLLLVIAFLSVVSGAFENPKDSVITHIVSEKEYSVKYEFKGNRSPAIVSNK